MCVFAEIGASGRDSLGGSRVPSPRQRCGLWFPAVSTRQKVRHSERAITFWGKAASAWQAALSLRRPLRKRLSYCFFLFVRQTCEQIFTQQSSINQETAPFAIWRL